MDIQVKEFQAPVIKINYETLSAELDKLLGDYDGLVVTEQTLAGCKAAQKELASLRTKIDAYRKEKKKELEQPIKHFDAQCKDLIAKVERVEQPIKDGIKVFDDQKREEKRQKALQIIKEVAEATGLNEKYTAKLDVLDKYMNLTATEKAVREDLDTRAFALKVEQDREAERLEIINSVLASENSRLHTKLSLDLWQRDIDADVPTSVILEKIKAQAKLVYEAENKPKEEPKTEPQAEIPQTPYPPEQPTQETPQSEAMYKVTYEVVGSHQHLLELSAFLKQHGLAYKVTSQFKI